MTMFREGWFVAQGAIGYEIVYPWACHMMGVSIFSVWWYAAIMLGFGAACTLIRKATEY